MFEVIARLVPSLIARNPATRPSASSSNSDQAAWAAAERLPNRRKATRWSTRPCTTGVTRKVGPPTSLGCTSLDPLRRDLDVDDRERVLARSDEGVGRAGADEGARVDEDGASPPLDLKVHTAPVRSASGRRTITARGGGQPTRAFCLASVSRVRRRPS